MNVAERIRERRKALGLSAEEVAEKMGISPATVYRYESADITNMRIDKLEPIARALQTTPAYLMGWTDEAEDSENTVNPDKPEMPSGLYLKMAREAQDKQIPETFINKMFELYDELKNASDGNGNN